MCEGTHRKETRGFLAFENQIEIVHNNVPQATVDFMTFFFKFYEQEAIPQE